MSRIWLVLLALCTAWSMSSCAVSDGPFEPVNGKRIDPASLKTLEARGATIDEVIVALGQPTDRIDLATSSVLVYRSVRERRSRESIAGFQVKESAQQFVEVWELVFRNGTLRASKLSSQIEER